jgi:hypothetical protein
MTDIHSGTTAKTKSKTKAKSKSFSQKDIYVLMRDVIKDNPGLESKKIVRKWLEIVRDDPDMDESALELAGRFVYNSVLQSKPRRNRVKMEARAERVRSRVARHLFSFVMPNGKPLGKCTFGEVTKFGEGFTQLGKMGRPKEIIEDTITEAQARKAVV